MENEEFVEINFIETTLERIYIRRGNEVLGEGVPYGDYPASSASPDSVT